MKNLPLSIQNYLSSLWLGAGKFAYITFDCQGHIKSWHSDIEHYGLKNLHLSDNISEKLIFLEGWFSCDENDDVFILDFVNFEDGVVADIHILPAKDETYILFIDVSEKFQQRQALQQERHNIELLNLQQSKNIELLRQTQQELEARKKQAEMANESKTKLLSYITHDLRTPLSAILGFAQFLEAGIFGELNQKQRDCVNNMLGAGTHMTGLINEILEVARLENGNIELSTESVAVDEITQDCLNLLEPIAQKQSIKLINRIQHPVKIQVDRKCFKQILINLINNAIKYNRKNGCIIVRYKIVNEKLRICIKDTGIGITEDKIDHIFQPFVRSLDSEQEKLIEGDGIGLSGCKRLIGLMSGSLSVRSELNIGSVFYVDFPLSFHCYGRNNYYTPQRLIYFYDDIIHFELLCNLLTPYPSYELIGYRHGEDMGSLTIDNEITFMLIDIDNNDVAGKLRQLQLLEKHIKPKATLAVFEKHTDAFAIKYVLEQTYIEDYLIRPFDFNQLLDILEP
ncbi:MAG: HAMP domain-containing sensor histidine kinase [Methylococcales bacterium]|nr:HAMP domain-containing sensor histidine kinase [Methylococcales bacterium]